MDRDGFESMLMQMAASWTAGDYELVAEKFAPGVFYSDGVNYTLYDRPSLLAFFRDDGGYPQACRFHRILFDEKRQLGAAEYTYEGHFAYHGTVWIDLRGGLIVSWREYQHRTERKYADFWNLDE